MAMVLAVSLLSAGFAMPGMAKKKPTDKFYEHAIELISQGDLKGGTVELKNAIKADAKDIAARILLGNTYLDLDDGDAAAEHLLQARKDGADDSFIVAPLAQAYVLQGRYEEALKELGKSIDNQSIATEIAVIRGDAHLGLRHYGEAEKYFLDALKIRPNYYKALDGLTQVKIATDDLTGAATYVGRALESKSDDRVAWFAKGEIARLRHDEDAALGDYGRAAELSPHYVPPRLARARILIDRKQYRVAEDDIVAIREVDAQNPHAAFLHALVLADKGEVKAARDALAAAETNLKNAPDAAGQADPPTLFLRGVIAYFRKDYTNAYRHLTAYLKHFPHHVGALKLLASLALSNGDTDYALTLLVRLAPRTPEDVEVQIMYGDALMRAKRHGEAIEVLKKAVAVPNPGQSALSRLVMLRATAGQNAEARKTMKLEMSRKPQAVQAALLMATAQLNEREFALALETAASVIELKPDNAVAHNLVGGALIGLNDIEGARSSFRAAIEAAPKFTLAISNLAKLEFNQGNLPAAERLYGYMLEQDARNGPAMVALAEIDVLRDDLDGALNWLRKARRKSRTPNRAALHLVDFYIYANRPDEALAVARDLNVQDHDNLDYLTALGRARLAGNRLALAAITFQEIAIRAFEKKSVGWLVRNEAWQMRSLDEQGARDSLQKALALDGKDLAAHLAFFRLEMAADKFDAALARADSVVALDRYAAVGHVLRGDALMRMGKTEPALAAYEEAFRRSGRYPQAVRVYSARRAAGRDALKFAQDWAAQRPDDEAAQRLLATAYDDADRGTDAIAVYEALLKKAPRDARLLTSMALLYQKHDPRKALETMEQAFRAAPAEPAVMDAYGWILVQQGSLDEGLTLLRKAKLRAPSALGIRYHMAVALNRMGKQDDARRELRAALQAGQDFTGAKDARALMSALDAPPPKP